MAKKKQTVKVKSTQMFSPIRDVKDGIIITKDGRFIKLMEFSPINFNLRSAEERAAIIESFASALKLLPTNAQWKVLSKPANIGTFITKIEDQMKTEPDQGCQALQRDQIRLISNLGARGGASRRFLIAFEYEMPPGVAKRPPFQEIRADLETTAMRIANVLAPCGNELLSPSGDDRYTIETLYSIFCRGESESSATAFEDKMKEVVFRYMMENPDADTDKMYIPVNDFICPKEIDSAESPKYIVVDGMYYSFCYIPAGEYPTQAVGGWLSMLINFGIGVDCDLFMHKESIQAIQPKLQYSIRYNRVKARGTEDSAAGYEELLDAINSGFYLRQGISSGEDFIYMSTMMTVCARSAAELKDKTNALKAYLLTQNLKVKFCLFQQEAAFQSALPICKLDPSLYKKCRRNILTSSLASAYPFVSFEVADPNGIMCGLNKSNNSMVFIDPFDSKQYKNANMVILGTSGAGKTYTMQCLALRMRQQKTQVFIIAPEKGHEFKRACTAVGGQFIKIAAGSPQNINIMEIRKKDDSVSQVLDGAYKDSILAKKIQQIHTFMNLLIPDISYEERQQLDEALVKTYAKFGISHRNRSLADPATGNYKKMPILGDLHETLGSMGDPARRLYNILSRYVTGSAKSFNAQTNVNLDNKYIVLDLSSLTKELLPIGMFIALDYVYDKARENRTQKKAIFVDEAWLLMGAQNFVVEIFKLIRGYGGAAIAASQEMQDFINADGGKFGKAVINNAKTKIIMGMEQEEADFVSESLALTPREVTQITRFKRGEALIVSNSNHLLIKFCASEHENDLITTDREQLANLAEKKKNAAS